VFWRTYAQIVKMTVKMMKQDRVQKYQFRIKRMYERGHSTSANVAFEGVVYTDKAPVRLRNKAHNTVTRILQFIHTFLYVASCRFWFVLLLTVASAFELQLERARAEERRQEGLVTREVCAVDARESGDFIEEVEVRA
jgi:hypothetical protein